MSGPHCNYCPLRQTGVWYTCNVWIMWSFR